jgi:uncharacterized hydrophobic protein (TIGR00271 family)
MSERDPVLPASVPSPAHALLAWWRVRVVGTVDQRAAIEKVQEDSGWNAHYAFMTLMSAGIAILGLLLSSPAVIIGAMLVSPLMGPIIGLGFAAATFDSVELRRSAVAVLVGAVVAILFAALIVLLSPLQTITPEIAARTRPNLFDLMVALFSGLAGTYATIRGRHGTIVGVAIATALMPPLAVIGYGLATLNATAFFGALVLFFTNLMTISLATVVLARFYGFGHTLSPRQTGLQATVLIALFVALAVPLGFALRQIAWETVASHQSRDVIARLFGGEARLSQIDVDYDARPIRVDAIVLTPRYRQNAEAEAAAQLEALLRRPVEVNIEQFRVGTAEAETTQLAAARGAAADRGAARVAERLALVAGVDPDQVLIDRGGGRAVVTASPLAGAPLESYRLLEARVAAAEPRWRVQLRPPAAALPPVPMDGAAPADGAGQAALTTAIWGARRLGLAIGVSGARADQIETVIAALEEAGVEAFPAGGGAAEGGAVRLSWLPPRAPGE